DPHGDVPSSEGLLAAPYWSPRGRLTSPGTIGRNPSAPTGPSHQPRPIGHPIGPDGGRSVSPPHRPQWDRSVSPGRSPGHKNAPVSPALKGPFIIAASMNGPFRAGGVGVAFPIPQGVA